MTATKLAELHSKIHGCHVCPLMNKEKASRNCAGVDPNTDTFIISQALAENTLRRSGLNFFDSRGNLGSTGINLEKFLNSFRRTVYPPIDVTLSSGDIVKGKQQGYVSVYNTEITQCFPGKKKRGGGDRVPTSKEIKNCIEQDFLIEEIRLIQPKLILLMGKKSRDSFYQYFLDTRLKNTLSEHISQIAENGYAPQKSISNLDIYVVPIQHASGANPRFFEMLRNKGLIQLIKKCLQ